MDMIPVHVIAFFIALMLIPPDVHEFGIELQGKKVQWTKTSSSAWHAVEWPRTDRGDYAVTNAIVIVRGGGKESQTDLSKYLKLRKQSDLSGVKQFEVAVEALGTPILIQRENGRIVLSQHKGALFESRAVISWKAKEK